MGWFRDNIVQPLLEGFTGTADDDVRRRLESDKERIAEKVRRSGLYRDTGSQGAGGIDSGYSGLADHLAIEHDLLSRYMDYEEMDDFPELGCVAGDSLVFTLEYGWAEIRGLAEMGGSFHVLSYDRSLRSLVPARATKAVMSAPEGHGKPMVKVTLDNGQTIRCTADHPFMTKDGAWVEAGLLTCGQRLMPGALRMRALSTSAADGLYWQVHQPNHDSMIRTSDGQRWTWIHRLVGEMVLGAEKGEIVHHKNVNSLDNAPSNLEVMDAREHIAGLDNTRFLPEWTNERRVQAAERMRGNTFSVGNKLSDEHKAKIGAASRKPKSAAHRRAIGMGQPTRINLAREHVEAALLSEGTVAAAAKKLGVSWSTLDRRAREHDLIAPDANHRVMMVETLSSREPVYDLEVKGLHNYICNGVVVHNTGLDIYADDTVQSDVLRNKSIWITSEDERIKEIGNELLHETLRVEEDLWGSARTLCKYGNCAAELLVAQDKGVVGMTFMPPATVRRIEDYDGTLLGFLQDVRGQGMPAEEFKKLLNPDGSLRPEARAAGRNSVAGVQATSPVIPFEGWEVVHWRLRGKWMRSQYGHGVFESARYVFRRLTLLEDASVLHRLTRAPARYAYYIDTGDLGPNQALAYVNDIKRKFKKKKYVNAQGKMEFKVNPLSVDEDFWVPTKGGKESTRIEVLSSAEWNSIEDLRYFRQKLLAAIKIPAAYLGMSDSGDDARASLSSQDVRFAKTILRIQREIKNGYRKVMRVHLAALGIDPNGVKWDVEMASPSSIFELAQIEVRNAQADLAARMADYASRDWIMQHIFDFSADEAAEMVDKQQTDLEDKMVHQAEVQKKTAGILGVDEMDTPPAPDRVPAFDSSKEAGTGDKRPSPGKGKPGPGVGTGGDDENESARFENLRRSIALRRANLPSLTEAEVDEWVKRRPWQK